MWTYEEPIDEASWLRGLVSVYPERMDAWLDEDEEVTGLRDPYHRVDARRSSRRIEVRADGEVLARSERPVVVAETGLPLRFYLPREDVLAELRPSDTTATCPYKGARVVLVARRRRGRRPGPTRSRWRACSRRAATCASTRARSRSRELALD